MTSEDVLRKMAERARAEVATRQKLKSAALLTSLARAAPKAVALEAALRRSPAPVVIAGLWRRTPTRILDRDIDLVEAVEACEAGGAAAIALSAETAHLNAVADDFPRVRAATRLPLVRHDVVVDSYQLAEARIAGASAVWFIEAALPGRELARLLVAARDVGLESIIEVVTDDGLERVLDAGAAMLVVSTSPAAKERDNEALARVLRLVSRAVSAGALPLVSGVDDPFNREEFERAGASVFLVDAPIVLADDKCEAVKAWRGAGGLPRLG